MFKDLLFPHFTQDFCVVLCLVFMEVEGFLKLFNRPVILEAGKGMDTSTPCNTDTWTIADLFLPKLVHLNDAWQLSLEKLALV